MWSSSSAVTCERLIGGRQAYYQRAITPNSRPRHEGQKAMRPIYWGVIWFFIGMVGWVFFSVIVGVGTGLGGEASPLLWGLMYLFGVVFFFSLPGAIVAEIVRWVKRKRTSTTSTLQPHQPSAVGALKYCQQCGNPTRPGTLYCDRCGQRL